jgi:hypothetical protein
VQFTHGAERRFAHIEPGFDQVAHFQQAHAEAVVAGFGAVHISANHQVVQDAVGGGRVQAGFFADDLQRHRVLVRGQQIQQLKHALQHLDAGRFGFSRFHGVILSQFACFLYGENASCITRCDNA